jgi:thymidine kinase
MAYLELIIGPMFSGKTSKLLDIYKECNFCNIKCVIINHSLDTRYTDTMVSTHDSNMAPCIFTDQLSKIWDFEQNIFNEELEKADVILINEGQFFDNLYTVVYNMLSQQKIIYICGLDGDFERKKFGCILDLIPICDKVTKLNSLCSKCKDGTPGIFSMRITNETEQTLIGSDNYIPVCRKCYVVN